jgi:hypothetical protein
MRRSRLTAVVILMGLATLVLAVPVTSPAATYGGCVARAVGSGTAAGTYCKFTYAGGKVRVQALGATTSNPANFYIQAWVHVWPSGQYVTSCSDGPSPATCSANPAKPSGIPKGTVMRCSTWTNTPSFSFVAAVCTSGTS